MTGRKGGTYAAGMHPVIAILVGSWGLPSFLLGVVESSLSKKRFLSASLLVLCLANVLLAFSIWDAARFWRSMLLQWLFYAPLLAPCLVANAIGLVCLTENAKLTKTLENPRVRTLVAIALASVALACGHGIPPDDVRLRDDERRLRLREVL